MVKIALRFLPFCAICAALRAAQMAISNSLQVNLKSEDVPSSVTVESYLNFDISASNPTVGRVNIARQRTLIDNFQRVHIVGCVNRF